MENQQRIAVIGSGGRESALVDAYAKNPHVTEILVIPGNDLMLTNPKVTRISTLPTTDTQQIVHACIKRHISFVDIAQDNAVASGLANQLTEQGIAHIGPTKEAGQIEWDKAWSREAMSRWGIPQPVYHVFTHPEEGIAFISNQPEQKWFVKASGLAEGKGALSARTNEEVIARIQELSRFGVSGQTYLIEEWLEGDNNSAGEEFSAFAISDGNTWQLIGYAQDHKRVLDGDKGENTGGMGCVTPPLVIDNSIDTQTRDIFSKTFTGLKSEGRPYKGILYFGGMIITKNGNQKVYAIEYNARWGDPEAEVIIPGIKNDLLDIGLSVNNQMLEQITLQTDNQTRLSVALTAQGYPEDYSSQKGKEITGIEQVQHMPNIRVYGAGIRRASDGKLQINGGRIIHIVGEGKNVLVARARVYDAISRIGPQDGTLYFRRDIGWRDVKRIKDQN